MEGSASKQRLDDGSSGSSATLGNILLLAEMLNRDKDRMDV